MGRLTLIAVPYAAGRLDEGMGAGPSRYLNARPELGLAGAGHDVDVVSVRAELDGASSEPEAVARVDARLAAAVSEVLHLRRFPLVLAGNCNSCLGTLAGLQRRRGAIAPRTGVVWFDSHGDVNTPGLSADGLDPRLDFFDGMGLAIATGRAYPDVRERIGLHAAIPESRVLHLGSRDLDETERRHFASTAMLSLTAARLQDADGEARLEEALVELASRVDEVYLHIDIDVLSGEYAPGVDFPSPGGLSLDELVAALRAVTRRLTLSAAALTAYDPERERDQRTLRSGLGIIQEVADLAI